MDYRHTENLTDSFQECRKQKDNPHNVLLCVAVAGLMLLLTLAVGCSQKTKLGLIGNQKVDRINAFNSSAITLEGDVSIPRGANSEHYAMAISTLGNRGYVSGVYSSTIHVVSLKNMPPTVSKTFNATHSASLLATPPGQQALMFVAAGRDGRQGVVSTINAVNGNEIDRIKLGQDTHPQAITVCDNDETILVAVDVPHEVRKFTIANDGSLLNPGKSYPYKHGTRAADVVCAPDSKTGVVVMGHGGASGGSGNFTYAESFDLKTMTGNHTQRLAGQIGYSAVLSQNGKTLYIHSGDSNFLGRGYIEAFTFRPKTGQFGSVTNGSAPVMGQQFLRDPSTLAIDGSRLFVTDRLNDRVLVLDSGSLSMLQTLSGNFKRPLEISITP